MHSNIKKVLEIIAENFPNGIRDDFIDTNRVSKIYSATGAGGNILPEFVAAVIRAKGIENNGRFYFISDADSENLLRLLDEILASNFIAYYSAIYERHADFFAQRHIFSPEVLKKILRQIDSTHFYFSDFCSAHRMNWVNYEAANWLDIEITGIFMEAESALALEDLLEKIPYVPAEKISELLSESKKFFLTRDGKFFPAFKIQFDVDEIRAAKRQIISAIKANGYAAPEDYSLDSNFALNPELSEKDLLAVIYDKFFAADFDKRRQKIYRKGDATSARPMNALREFVAEFDELSADKLFAAAENFGITTHAAMDVAFEKMVRVEKNLFVADALINFDVDATDEALAPFVNWKIIPLRAVTSFTGFPPVDGFSWSLYMLESFLRKFSEKYSYASPAANSANIGAVYPKSMKFKNYTEVQAAAVVQENVPLEKSAVEKFLIGKGYRSRRSDKAANEIISRAQEFSNR